MPQEYQVKVDAFNYAQIPVCALAVEYQCVRVDKIAFFLSATQRVLK